MGFNPDDGVTTPDDGVTTPDDGVTTPDDGVTTPDDGVTTPDDGVMIPLGEMNDITISPGAARVYVAQFAGLKSCGVPL